MRSSGAEFFPLRISEGVKIRKACGVGYYCAKGLVNDDER